jgi:hypothetical protein
MNVFHALSRPRWRPAVLGLVVATTFSGTAAAAVNDLTLNDTAKLSPGMLHATLTGSVTCDPGDYSPYISGQITQSHGASGYGSTTATCDGTPQPFSIDVTSGGIFGGAGAFKPGKANAQVSISTCDPITWVCSSKYSDAVIRLTK